ncbi:hypothetical protein GLYMA_06G144900v4 [Glycine max]|nr:hypothetical protein GLYMA_06G144900v4 [Glycine max]KAH1125911.1 hypothetical protein GYH30_015100 [Glycine max]
MNEFLYSALRTSPLRKEVSCCRGNFSCFVILRACHHVLYDPSFQAVLGFPFVVCFSTFLPICLRAFWQTLTRKRERRQTLWLFFGDISLMHCTPAGKADSDYKLKIAGKQPLRFQDKAAYSYPLRIPAGWKPCPLNWSC